MRALSFAAVAFLACLPACNYIEIPLYDEGPLLAAHPTLAGKVIEATKYKPPEVKEEEIVWIIDDERVLSPGDPLKIQVPDDLSLNRTIRIEVSGEIGFPHAGRFRAAGMKVSAFRNKLNRSLSSILKRPQVVVWVSRSSGARVNVAGMINTQKDIDLGKGTWISGAIMQAGGRSRLANITQILVVRPAEKKVIVCNLYEYQVNGDQKQNIVASDGDVIVVTRRYPLAHQSCAREWKPIADYFAGSLDRAGLINAINNLPPPAWKDKE